MKQFDNNSVYVTANRGTADISHKVQRWDGKAKKHVMVDCPNIVKNYNSAKGGVGLADMLISLYLTPYKTRRWYLWVAVHLLDICKVRKWLLYKRYATQLKMPIRRQMKLAEFTSKIANALIYRGKPSDRLVGRPKKRLSEDRTEQRGKMLKTAAPQDDVRFDEIGH